MRKAKRIYSQSVFTVDQREFIRVNYAKMTSKEMMANFPGYKTQQISNCAKRMGISKDKSIVNTYPLRNGAFTDAEANILIEKYADSSFKELSLLMPGRTHKQINGKAAKMGLVKSDIGIQANLDSRRKPKEAKPEKVKLTKKEIQHRYWIKKKAAKDALGLPIKERSDKGTVRKSRALPPSTRAWAGTTKKRDAERKQKKKPHEKVYQTRFIDHSLLTKIRIDHKTEISVYLKPGETVEQRKAAFIAKQQQKLKSESVKF